MQFAQKIRKLVKSLPCYLELYCERPLPEHFFSSKKQVSVAIKQIPTCCKCKSSKSNIK